jgi:hypothetical protein
MEHYSMHTFSGDNAAAANPSGLSGYTLLDVYGIPPSTIELALRDGQAARAERGIGLSRQYGGPW